MSDVERRKSRANALTGSRERRHFPVGDVEVREAMDGRIRMAGYGSVTDTPYEVGGFVETIRGGAFKRSLAEGPKVALLFAHDGMPYASTGNGTLTLNEDSHGLHWEASLDAEDPDSRTLARKVQQGLIDECSFAFQVTSDDWSADYKVRTIKSLSIHRGDVSLVVAGANPATSVSMRARQAVRVPNFTSDARREFEILCRGGKLPIGETPRPLSLAAERQWLEAQRRRAV